MSLYNNTINIRKSKFMSCFQCYEISSHFPPSSHFPLFLSPLLHSFLHLFSSFSLLHLCPFLPSFFLPSSLSSPDFLIRSFFLYLFSSFLFLCFTSLSSSFTHQFSLFTSFLSSSPSSSSLLSPLSPLPLTSPFHHPLLFRPLYFRFFNSSFSRYFFSSLSLLHLQRLFSFVCHSYLSPTVFSFSSSSSSPSFLLFPPSLFTLSILKVCFSSSLISLIHLFLLLLPLLLLYTDCSTCLAKHLIKFHCLG